MYAQKEKPKESKSKAVANSVTQKKSGIKQGFGFVDNRPEANYNKIIEPKSTIYPFSDIVQRYHITEAGKVSASGKMEVKNNGDLHAKSTGVTEANQRSPLSFSGDGTADTRAIVNVSAGTVATGNAANQLGSHDDVDMVAWKNKALSEVVGRVNRYVDDQVEFLEEDDEKMNFLKERFGIDDPEHFELEFYKRCSEWRHDLLANAVERIEEYANDPRHTDETRLVLTTDCGVMANVVTGKNLNLFAEGVDTHHYVGPGAGDETIVEWSHHVAATIMTDDGDYVTMENAAAKTTDFFSKPIKDSAWEYRMFGTDEGQSFSDKFKPLMSGGREFIDGEWVDQEE